MIVDLISIMILQFGSRLNPGASVATEVRVCHGTCINRRTRLLYGFSKRSTMTAGSVLLELLLAKLNMDYFLQALLRLSGSPVHAISCNALQIGCIDQKKQTLRIGTVPAKAIEICEAGTMLSFSLCSHRRVPSIAPGFQRIGVSGFRSAVG